jgi:hypothetical protein
MTIYRQFYKKLKFNLICILFFLSNAIAFRSIIKMFVKMEIIKTINVNLFSDENILLINGLKRKRTVDSIVHKI